MNNLTCPVCDKEFYRRPSYIKKIKSTPTCSHGCRIIYGIGKYASNWKGGITTEIEITCNHCGELFMGNKNRKYCSPECGSKSVLGKVLPKRGKRVNLICDWCGIKFNRLECNIKESYNHCFCSTKCMSEWKRINTSGEKNWKWISDRTKLANYGTNKIRGSTRMTNWRNSILERDEFKCQLCGILGDKKSLRSHHIKKFSVFPELMFDILNGITLCIDCHKLVTWNEEEYEELFDNIVNGVEC